QADRDDGAGQHADRDQSAFTVASHNKRAHPLVERRAPPTKGESTGSAGWAQASMHQPRTSCVFIPNAEHFQQCAEFLPFRNRGLGRRAVTVLPVRFAGRPAATSLRRRAIDSAPFSSLGERQKGRPAVTERRGLPLAGDWLLLRRTRSRGRKTPQ